MAYRHEYLATSLRDRSDETDVLISTDTIYDVGDTLILDGIIWYIVKVIH